jgi:hypothetical protein
MATLRTASTRQPSLGNLLEVAKGQLDECQAEFNQSMTTKVNPECAELTPHFTAVPLDAVLLPLLSMDMISSQLTAADVSLDKIWQPTDADAASKKASAFCKNSPQTAKQCRAAAVTSIETYNACLTDSMDSNEELSAPANVLYKTILVAQLETVKSNAKKGAEQFCPESQGNSETASAKSPVAADATAPKPNEVLVPPGGAVPGASPEASPGAVPAPPESQGNLETTEEPAVASNTAVRNPNEAAKSTTTSSAAAGKASLLFLSVFGALGLQLC